MTSHATSSSKRQQTATSPANTVRGKKSKKTWSSPCSSESWTSATPTGHAVFHFTSSESPFSTPIFWKQYNTLRRKTKDIQSFLQRMERYLTNSSTNFWLLEWTESSGRGVEITLRPTPLNSFRRSEWSDSSSKKR